MSADAISRLAFATLAASAVVWVLNGRPDGWSALLAAISLVLLGVAAARRRRAPGRDTR